MATIWELDFYSRPILDENKKKLWELLICESSTKEQRNSLFRYSQFCSNQTVNSVWLKEALEKAIEEAGESPKKVRFFRRQMNNMITKACEDLGIIAMPSRRTFMLNQWLRERQTDFYPDQAGYDQALINSPEAQYPLLNAMALPEAIRGDKRDKWAFLSLEASAFAEIGDWAISFGESFPLEMVGIADEKKIPGLIIFSERALPLAAWMSGLDMGYLKLERGDRPFLRLETGASDSWILVNITDSQTLAEAEQFEQKKMEIDKVHFLAVQTNPESDSFSGFWLLKEETAI